MRKHYIKTTWIAVEGGDTALLPWLPIDRIVEVLIVTCTIADDHAAVIFEFGGCRHGRIFDANETIYVQSRL